ncbi:pentapeptide repeat-containing protein [Bradyrhizobium sp. CCBAU 51627]|uniref:pentapeptide repeat-containing protein n=1 Tax=Bradyrhizobium sp. CCBAU 51627 TaxID=1325088 RepID=UPI0023057950|nr:pentapeptide repeat-containing protein [Bradyrhizobium sp. CCBAU 51627]
MVQKDSQLPLPSHSGTDVLSKWTNQSDFTGETLVGLDLTGRSVRQSLFSGTLFRDCNFRECDFSRSDFEASIFESCTFFNCDFTVADFRSADTVNSTFEGCSFQQGSVRASRYEACTFRQCSFELQTFEENELAGTALIDCIFHRATLLHCRFEKTRFERTDLSDCTSQYHLFVNCGFEKCGFNAESVGLTFGLSLDNLNDLTLVWRGTPVERASGPMLVKDLLTTYEARRWPFLASILSLNFTLLSPVDSFDYVFSSIADEPNGRRAVGADELRFLGRVLELLSGQARLPFLSIARGLEKICGIAEGNQRHTHDALKLLAHTLKDAEYAELAAMDSSIEPLASMLPADDLKVSFVFDNEPSISFSEWICGLHESGYLPGLTPRLLETRSGSYIEILSLSVATLSSLLICLSMIERIVDRVIYIRARAKILFSPQLPAVIRRRALQPIAAPSATLTREMQKYLELASSSHSRRIVSDLEQFTPKLLRVEIDQNSSHSLS